MKRTKYVALLRGINVGGNNTISMLQLKQVFEKLGFESVSTYINSGNVIFESTEANNEKLVKKIEEGIKKEFRLTIKVLLKNLKDIKKICSKVPYEWENDSNQRTDVLFLWEDYNKKSSLGLIKINPGIDNLRYVDGAIVWNMKRSDYKKSKMNKFVGTEVYKHTTIRNINTARKLLQLMSGNA